MPAPEITKPSLESSSSTQSFPWSALVRGSGGRAGLGVLCRPLDVVRVKVQDPTGVNPCSNAREYFKSRRSLPISSTFKELTAGTMLRATQAGGRDAIRLGILFNVDNWFGNSEGNIVKGFAKAGGVVLSDVVAVPVDTLVVKFAQNPSTALSNQTSLYRTAYQAGTNTFSSFGNVLKAAYPRQIIQAVAPKQGVQAGAFIVVGDAINMWFRTEEGRLEGWGAFSASLATGAIAGAATFPCDHYKTLAQLNNGNYSIRSYITDFSRGASRSIPGVGIGFGLRVIGTCCAVLPKNLARIWAQNHNSQQETTAMSR